MASTEVFLLIIDIGGSKGHPEKCSSHFLGTPIKPPPYIRRSAKQNLLTLFAFLVLRRMTAPSRFLVNYYSTGVQTEAFHRFDNGK